MYNHSRKHEENRQLRRRRQRWDDNTEMDFNKVVNSCERGDEPPGTKEVGNFIAYLLTVSV
jgi:hypothetical protein